MEYKYSKHAHSKIGPTEAKFICENYPKMFCTELGKKFNVSKQTISNCLKLNNIPIFDIKYNLTLKYKNSKVPKFPVLYDLYFNKKLSTLKIAKMYDCSVSAIYSIFKKRNIKIRSYHESRLMLDYPRINKNGYVEIKIPQEDLKLFLNGERVVSEHRYVYSKHLNQPLKRNENIHHINGDRQDNRLSNLELWSKSQPAGQRVIDKIKYAKQILALYENDYNKGLIK